MKKTLIIVAALALLATTLVAPKIISIQTEANLNTLIETLNKNTYGFTASFTQYEANWFSSQAKLNIGSSYLPEQEIITLDIDVKHGPVIISPEFYIGLNLIQTQFDKTQSEKIEIPEGVDFDIKKVKPINAKISLFNALSVNYQIAPIGMKKASNNPNQADIDFDFGGIDFQLNYSPNNKIYSFEMLINQSEFKQAPQGSIQFDTMTITANGEYTPDVVINPGMFEISVPKLVTVNQGATSGFEDFTIKTVAEINNQNNLKIRYLLDIKKLLAAKIPDALHDYKLAIAIDNIDVNSLEQFYALMQDVLERTKLANGKTQTAEQTAAYEAKTIEIFQNMLAKKPTIKIEELSYQFGENDYSTANATFSLDLDVLGQISQQTQPDTIKKALVGNANLAVSKAFVSGVVNALIEKELRDTVKNGGISAQDLADAQAQQNQTINQFINNYKENGFIEETDTEYKAHLIYQKNQLTINGKAMPLPF